MERHPVFMDWKTILLKCLCYPKGFTDSAQSLSKSQWQFLQKTKNNIKIHIEPQKTQNS